MGTTINHETGWRLVVEELHFCQTNKTAMVWTHGNVGMVEEVFVTQGNLTFIIRLHLSVQTVQDCILWIGKKKDLIPWHMATKANPFDESDESGVFTMHFHSILYACFLELDSWWQWCLTGGSSDPTGIWVGSGGGMSRERAGTPGEKKKKTYLN